MTRPEEAGLIPVTVGEWHARPERLANAWAYVAVEGGAFIAVTVEPTERAGYFDLLFRVGGSFRTVPREATLHVFPDHYEVMTYDR